MKLENSYFVKFANGTSAWLAAGKPLPDNAIEFEVRQMIFPDNGKAFKHKATGTICDGGFWVKDGKPEDWEEIDIPDEYKEFLQNS